MAIETNKPTPKSDVPPRNQNPHDLPEVPQKQPPQSEPRRYDEADPVWREPDVQMRNPQTEQVPPTNTNVNQAH